MNKERKKEMEWNLKIYFVVESDGSVTTEQTVCDGDASEGAFGHDSAAVAEHAFAFRVGQDDGVGIGGCLQRRRPMRRVRETEMLHTRWHGRLQEN